MPLLNPNQIKSVLAEVGVKKDDIKGLLDANGLGPAELIEELGSAIRSADSSAMRLKGIETGLKLNGLLRNDDSGVQAPVVNIIINDAQFGEVNPILVPRS